MQKKNTFDLYTLVILAKVKKIISFENENIFSFSKLVIHKSYNCFYIKYDKGTF